MDQNRQDGAGPRLVVEAMARKDGGDLEGFLELFEPDCEIRFPGATLHGIQEWRAFVAPWFEAFPDGHYELHRLESIGQTVFAEGVWSATHTGNRPTPQGDLPPTGRKVAIRFALVVEVRNRRMASVHNYHDRLDLMAQLGLAPVPA
jgi:predicted ester cyclase